MGRRWTYSSMLGATTEVHMLYKVSIKLNYEVWQRCVQVGHTIHLGGAAVVRLAVDEWLQRYANQTHAMVLQKADKVRQIEAQEQAYCGPKDWWTYQQVDGPVPDDARHYEDPLGRHWACIEAKKLMWKLHE